jgi:ankyrin repeat protein
MARAAPVSEATYSFIRACVKGSLSEVRRLIAQGADVNVRGEAKRTPLMYACTNTKEKVAALLLDKGARINDTAPDVGTALNCAANRTASLVKLLLRKGADPEIAASGEDRWTPLMTAAWFGNEAIVKALLEKGAALERRDAQGRTPLLLAIENGEYSGEKRTALFLIQKGADIHAKDGQGNTPLILASRQDLPKLVKLLLKKGADPKEKNLAGEDASCFLGANPANQKLFDAVEADSAARVAKAIAGGATPNARRSSGYTPLLVAVEGSYFNAFRALLEHGADPSVESPEGESPLQLAKQLKRKSFVEILAGVGARSGQVEEKELVFQEGASNKFWKISMAGNSFTVTFGKVGTRGQSLTREFAGKEQCLREGRKLIEEKLRKGYRERRAGDAPVKWTQRAGIPIEAEEGEAALGASKLGGWPDLPASATWPCGEEGPLAFVCQINFAEFANDFADRGMLYIFTVPTPDDLGEEHAAVFYAGAEPLAVRKADLAWMKSKAPERGRPPVDAEVPLREYKLQVGKAGASGATQLFGRATQDGEPVEDEGPEKLVLQIDATQFGDTFRYVCSTGGMIYFRSAARYLKDKSFKSVSADMKYD